jgi:hypothetical protein
MAVAMSFGREGRHGRGEDLFEICARVPTPANRLHEHSARVEQHSGWSARLAHVGECIGTRRDDASAKTTPDINPTRYGSADEDMVGRIGHVQQPGRIDLPNQLCSDDHARPSPLTQDRAQTSRTGLSSHS